MAPYHPYPYLLHTPPILCTHTPIVTAILANDSIPQVCRAAAVLIESQVDEFTSIHTFNLLLCTAKIFVRSYNLTIEDCRFFCATKSVVKISTVLDGCCPAIFFEDKNDIPDNNSYAASAILSEHRFGFEPDDPNYLEILLSKITVFVEFTNFSIEDCFRIRDSRTGNGKFIAASVLTAIDDGQRAMSLDAGTRTCWRRLRYQLGNVEANALVVCDAVLHHGATASCCNSAIVDSSFFEGCAYVVELILVAALFDAVVRPACCHTRCGEAVTTALQLQLDIVEAASWETTCWVLSLQPLSTTQPLLLQGSPGGFTYYTSYFSCDDSAAALGASFMFVLGFVHDLGATYGLATYGLAITLATYGLAITLATLLCTPAVQSRFLQPITPCLGGISDEECDSAAAGAAPKSEPVFQLIVLAVRQPVTADC